MTSCSDLSSSLLLPLLFAATGQTTTGAAGAAAAGCCCWCCTRPAAAAPAPVAAGASSVAAAAAPSAAAAVAVHADGALLGIPLRQALSSVHKVPTTVQRHTHMHINIAHSTRHLSSNNIAQHNTTRHGTACLLQDSLSKTHHNSAMLLQLTHQHPYLSTRNH